jgi:hypothetical protein
MKELPLYDHVGLSQAELTGLRAVVSEHRGLDQVFAWGRKQHPPVHPADVVKQDEFTHDVLVPFSESRWIVYGTT